MPVYEKAQENMNNLALFTFLNSPYNQIKYVFLRQTAQSPPSSPFRISTGQ